MNADTSSNSPSFVAWSADLNTGIRSIDLQHQELVALINALNRLNQQQGDEAEVCALVGQLRQYVMFHFSHEEGLLRRSGLAVEQQDRHLQQHQLFSVEVDRAAGQLQSGHVFQGAAQLAKFLGDWLIQHIRGTDMELARQIASRGGADESRI